MTVDKRTWHGVHVHLSPNYLLHSVPLGHLLSILIVARKDNWEKGKCSFLLEANFLCNLPRCWLGFILLQKAVVSFRKDHAICPFQDRPCLGEWWPLSCPIPPVYWSSRWERWESQVQQWVLLQLHHSHKGSWENSKGNTCRDWGWLASRKGSLLDI